MSEKVEKHDKGGNSFVLIVVLFILLIIVGASYTRPYVNTCGCGGYGYNDPWGF